ncbi:hypothetical protein ACIBU0_13325 [Streptomyces sp. NPDC049627]|uniref:hypothetical protein n=1 Tax=Streptomyces sp. NPDC049627 TaxID=3365595 RepID=UPI0037B7ABB4
MGKRVLAAFGVVAPMDGVLASGLSAAPTSADAATSSSTAERTGSSKEAQLWAPYRQAVAEGGRLVVLTGGDRSGQDDYLKNAFAKTFPKTKVDIVVDFSKNHDARVDHQAAEHHVIADVVHLQTLDDFLRRKKEGSLENCTPVGWNTVHPQIKELTDTCRWVAWPQTGVSPQERSIPGRRQAVPEPAAVQGRAGARNRARPDVAPPAGRKGIFDHATMNPLGLGQFMSDRAALDRYEARLGLCIGHVHGANLSDPTSSDATRSTSGASKAEPLLDTGCPPRSGSRRTPRREAIPPTLTLHPRKHA